MQSPIKFAMIAGTSLAAGSFAVRLWSKYLAQQQVKQLLAEREALANSSPQRRAARTVHETMLRKAKDLESTVLSDSEKRRLLEAEGKIALDEANRWLRVTYQYLPE